MKYCFYYRTKIGMLAIVETNQKISDIFFENQTVSEDIEVVETVMIRECYLEIQEYLSKKRTKFELDFLLTGSDFAKLVYQELLKLPYGEVITYKELAKRIKRPLAYRAVGNACKYNRLPLIIPCHRVIGSNQKLGGYAGGVEIKKQLLTLEDAKV